MVDVNIIRFKTLESTQDSAIGIIHSSRAAPLRSPLSGAAHDWTVVAADCQTKGRGRKGAVWYSPANVNLYFSMITRPPVSVTDVAVMNHTAALSVAHVLSDYGLVCRIKWPNDVQVNGKKICGMLSTSCTDRHGDRHVICGVGLNVNLDGFPQEFSDRATSMLLETGRSFDRDELLGVLLEAIKSRFELLFERGFAREIGNYVSSMIQLGKAYTDVEGSFLGKVEGIDEKGRLLVNNAGELKAISM